MSPFILLTGISTCLKAWILWLGKSRKVMSEFRWFFLYLIYALAESVVRVASSSNGRLYMSVYWSTEALAITLLSIAFGESFSRTLRPFAIFKWVRRAFWVCVATPVVYSVTRSIIVPPAHAGLWAQLIIGVEITLHYLIVAITILYFVLVRLFDIRDHRYQTGIILGFGFNSIGSACGYLVRSIFATKLVFLSSGLPPLAFVIAEAVWGITLKQRPSPPEAAPRVSLTPDEIIRVLDEYLEMLRALFRTRWF